MGRKIKQLGFLVLLSLVIGGGTGFYVFSKLGKAIQPTVEQEATVLLEQIRLVAKIVAVEGQFSEIVSYKNYVAYDWSPLRKKALVRVKATVSVGYDLSSMNLQSDAESKRIFLTWDPSPEILSVEHELDYYDLTAGTFNNFNEADYNRINGLAVDQIRHKAQHSGLYEAAERQARQMLNLIDVMVNAMGWQLVVREKQVAFSE